MNINAGAVAQAGIIPTKGANIIETKNIFVVIYYLLFYFVIYISTTTRFDPCK